MLLNTFSLVLLTAQKLAAVGQPEVQSAWCSGMLAWFVTRCQQWILLDASCVSAKFRLPEKYVYHSRENLGKICGAFKGSVTRRCCSHPKLLVNCSAIDVSMFRSSKLSHVDDSFWGFEDVPHRDLLVMHFFLLLRPPHAMAGHWHSIVCQWFSDLACIGWQIVPGSVSDSNWDYGRWHV